MCVLFYKLASLSYIVMWIIFDFVCFLYYCFNFFFISYFYLLLLSVNPIGDNLNIYYNFFLYLKTFGFPNLFSKNVQSYYYYLTTLFGTIYIYYIDWTTACTALWFRQHRVTIRNSTNASRTALGTPARTLW